MEVLLALDAGTTGVRTVAFGPDLSVLATAYRELTQYFPEPGWVEHDADEIATLAIETLDEVAATLSAHGHQVVALGITNQRETTVAFDRATGSPLHRAIVWQDRRTAAWCEQLEADGHLAPVRSRTGLVLDSYFSGSKMRWLLDHGVAAQATDLAFATIDAWLVWKLTNGTVFATEASNASRTMLMDIKSRQWSSEMLDLVGVPLATLPEIRPSIGDFGEISAVPSLKGVPIRGILGDQQAALFGQACFGVGSIKATYGTGSFILANAGEELPVVRDGLITTVAWERDGQATYAYEGAAFVAGAAIQWLRDELQIITSSAEVGPLAASVENAGGVAFIPAFTGLGSPWWRPQARGALMGLGRDTTRAHIARAVVDALAYQVTSITDAFREAGVEVAELRADGGASAMDDLLQLQATLSRVRVRRSTSLEATARGAASAAGLGAGFFSSLEELNTLWSSSLDCEPADPTLADMAYREWCRLLERA